MDLLNQILGIIFVIILFDSIFFGFFILIFKISPPYRRLLKDGILIRDEGSDWECVTWHSTRVRSVILTQKYLILTQNYLTSVVNIKSNSIKSYSIKPKLFSKKWYRIKIKVVANNKENTFSFRSLKSNEWIKAFSQIGVPKNS